MQRGHDAALGGHVALEVAPHDVGEAQARGLDGAVGLRPAAEGGRGQRRGQQYGRAGADEDRAAAG